MKNLNADLALITVALIWGCNFPVMKFALAEMPLFAFNAIRITISAVLLGLLHLREREQRSLPAGSGTKLLLLSVIGYFGYQMFFLTGLDRTSAGNSSLLIASAPIWAALTGRLLGDQLQGRTWVGLLIAFAGCAFIAVSGQGFEFGSEAMLGNLLTIGAAMTWGSYTALNRSLAEAVSPISLAFYTTVITLPLHWLMGMPQLLALPSISLSSWSYMLYSGVLATGLAYAMWNVGIRKIGPTHTTIYVNLVPVIALFTSYLWLGEVVNTTQIIGGAVTLGGLWLVRSRGSELD